MENTIIKFKNCLKEFQANRKKLLTECEKELELLQRIINVDTKLLKEYTTNGHNIEELNKKIIFARMFGFKDTILETMFTIDNNILTKISSKKRKIESIDELLRVFHSFTDFYNYLKSQYIQTRDIINAFENDKIKDPINNIGDLFAQIKYTDLTTEEISTIIGMGISFNSQYAKKNKNHQIQHLEMIDALSKYYNPDGTLKYNEDILSFNFLLKSLDELCYNETELLYRILNRKQMHFCNDIVILLERNNEKLRDSQPPIESIDKTPKSVSDNMSPKTIKALQTLRKYYKNGTIIEIPENLDEFYATLSLCELSEEEQRYIINSVNEKIANNNLLTKSSFLTDSEQRTYQTATNLLDTFSYSNGDAEVLKQYLEELQTILQMLESESNEENRQYLLNEIPDIIEQLSLICSRYTITDEKSTNRFIFLLDKNGIPFIFNDMENLEQTNQKAIYPLMTKIHQDNQSQFKKVMFNEPLSYNMYEVLNRRAHLSFVEVDAGIYVIIGADIPRNGYKELNQRLKANQLAIKRIEEAIKNPETREQILKSNEEYAEVFTNSETRVNKLTLKAHN